MLDPTAPSFFDVQERLSRKKCFFFWPSAEPVGRNRAKGLGGRLESFPIAKDPPELVRNNSVSTPETHIVFEMGKRCPRRGWKG